MHILDYIPYLTTFYNRDTMNIYLPNVPKNMLILIYAVITKMTLHKHNNGDSSINIIKTTVDHDKLIDFIYYSNLFNLTSIIQVASEYFKALVESMSIDDIKQTFALEKK